MLEVCVIVLITHAEFLVSSVNLLFPAPWITSVRCALTPSAHPTSAISLCWPHPTTCPSASLIRCSFVSTGSRVHCEPELHPANILTWFGSDSVTHRPLVVLRLQSVEGLRLLHSSTYCPVSNENQDVKGITWNLLQQPKQDCI